MRILAISILAILPLLIKAQNTVIIQQNSTNTTTSSRDSHEFYIQGISSREDIGGVDVETIRNSDPYGNPYIYKVHFRNYRNTPVRVLYEFTVGVNEDIRTGSITLGPNQTKSDDRWYKLPKNFKLIVRAL